MSEEYKKKELAAMIKLPGNNICNDCPAPNPQWASLSFGTFICLECSGVHRGFGVHISFVRSISMDKWSDSQMLKMKLGGNTNFQDFINAYGPEGGYKKGMGIKEKYFSWAAMQYRDKLSAMTASPPTEWSPSPPPPPSASSTLSPPGSNASSRPSSAQGVRKPRGMGASSSPLGYQDDANSRREANEDFFASMGAKNEARSTDLPPSQGGKYAGFGSGGVQHDEQQPRRQANESFFANLGSRNQFRSADLPPNQGGRYQGFGSTPEPSSSQHPSFALSSHNAPSLDELRTDPLAAAAKGWGLFSAALGAAGRTVQSSIVDPTLHQLADPNLQSSFRSGLSSLAENAQRLGANAGGFVKERAGVDLTGQFGNMGLGGGRGNRGGYSSASVSNGDSWGNGPASYSDYPEEDDYSSNSYGNYNSASRPAAHAPAAKKSVTPASANKKNEDWDDFEDF
ncbi:ADP-ribosylation factor GTPase activator [Phaffia rhodozyma]|uniref:ADP-ribosylation factor GTPase activator n=1 Tax=Phaffia rhodozyma TaxID=264483 RepID=A0A0F7SJ67_PHARH|nr:ADP-ribosylation factor GTPase activator [Phaffia rhodozyma]